MSLISYAALTSGKEGNFDNFFEAEREHRQSAVAGRQVRGDAAQPFLFPGGVHRGTPTGETRAPSVGFLRTGVRFLQTWQEGPR